MFLSVKNEHELKRAALGLRRAGGTVRKELTAAFKRSGEDTLRTVRQQIQDNNIKGQRVRRRGEKVQRFKAVRPSTGLRRKIARATTLDVTTSVNGPSIRFNVDVARLGASQQRLPKLIDDGKPWRHPVMGNREVWAGNRGTPWFRKTVLSRMKSMREECNTALDRAAAQIDRQLR